VRRTFPTKAEAKSWRASATTAIARQELRAVTSPTLAAAADDLLAGMASGAIRARGGDRFKPATIRAYEISLREHITPLLGRRRLNDISRGDLVDLVERMLGRGSSSSTIRNAINPLHLIYRRAMDRGIVTVSPAARLPLPAPAPGRDRIATPAEQAALIAALRAAADRALWTVALGAGLRAGELQALSWRDVDFEDGLIRVRRSFDPKSAVFGEPKSKRSRREVPMLGGVRATLLEHRLATGRRSGLVFGRDGEHPFTHSSALHRAARDWKAAGIPPLACDIDAADRGQGHLPPFGRIGLHEARHSYCTTLLDAGVSVANVSRYAGHASPAFTLARYVHPRADQAPDDAAKVDAFLALSVRAAES
jgi:integrase